MLNLHIFCWENLKYTQEGVKSTFFKNRFLLRFNYTKLCYIPKCNHCIVEKIITSKLGCYIRRLWNMKCFFCSLVRFEKMDLHPSCILWFVYENTKCIFTAGRLCKFPNSRESCNNWYQFQINFCLILSWYFFMSILGKNFQYLVLFFDLATLATLVCSQGASLKNILAKGESVQQVYIQKYLILRWFCILMPINEGKFDI